MGDDHRPANASAAELAQLSTGQDGGSTNTDTMMVLHLPTGSGAPTVISLPRDSWVAIPGFGTGKLNSAFADGAAHGGDAAGMRLLITTIQNLTGLSIDHFVRVSLMGFYDIVTVLGPIQVCLNQPAHDSCSGIDLPAGTSTLNAKQALSFVRQRHGLLRGDLDREVRQQYFLSTELHKVLSAGTLLDPAKTQRLLTAVSRAIETDPGLDVLGEAARFSSLSADKVTYTTLPITGTPTITDAAGTRISIVAVDVAAIPAFIDGILGTPSTSAGGPTPTAPSPSGVTPRDVTVRVVNATGHIGLAATTTAELARLGFTTVAPANAPLRTVTTIAYPTGRQPTARGAPTRRHAAGGRHIGTDHPDPGHRCARMTPAAPAAGASAGSASTAPSTPANNFSSASCIN